MVYTEEMKHQINSMGMEVIEFKRMIKDLGEIVLSISENVLEVIRKLWDEIKKGLELPPKQRYKFVKSLGVKNYEVFFQRNRIYRARSCC